MAGENGTFSAAGYGVAQYKVQSIEYGISAVFQESDARAKRDVYFRNITNDNFTILLDFSSWDDYNAAATWFQNYMIKVADPSNTTVSPMIVSVPVRNFIGYGIPQSGISFGDGVGEIVYHMSIAFTGTSDAVNPSDTLTNPAAGTNEAQAYFYPDFQQSGPGEAIYDAPPTPTVTPNATRKPNPLSEKSGYGGNPNSEKSGYKP